MNILQSLYPHFISPILSFLVFLVFASVIFSWLVGFGMINGRNPTAATIGRLLHQFTEPLIAPVRKILPPFGGLDFSPIVVILVLQWLNGYMFPRLLGFA